jgi:PadR family transcriptional regulator, regulatory protein PadR
MKLRPDSREAEKIQSAERWEQQIRKGALEMAAMAALWPGRLYGLEIIRRFQDSSQLALAEGTIYPILSRLKDEGLLASEWVEAEAGHPRKYYWLTAAGRTRLQQMAETWTEFSRELARLIKPVMTTPAMSKRAIAAQDEEEEEVTK